MKITITTLVAVHLIATLWHGHAHMALEIGLPFLKDLFVYVVILAGPLVGAILVWTRYATAGAAIVAAAMAGALVFGVYHHYVLVSPDNIAHLPAGAPGLQAQFINSAALIAIIELATALLGSYALGRSRAGKTGFA